MANRVARQPDEQRADGSWKMALPHGSWVLLDDEDYEWARHYAWHSGTGGYAQRSVKFGNNKGITILLHREIMGLKEGREVQVDHANGDRLDNRRSNLRIATYTQNCHNSSKRTNREYSSRYKGVILCEGEEHWRANIRLRNVVYRLGNFDNEEEAARAYDAAAVRLYGEFANLNFPA